MPAGDELLEDLAEHFRIDGYFNVERRRFRDGEIVAVKQVEDPGQLARSRSGANEQQIGHIHTDDQQKESDRAE